MPTVQRTTQYYHPKEAGGRQRTRDKNVAGFYQGEDADEDGEDGDGESHLEENAVDESFDSVNFWREPLPEIDLDLLEDLCQEEEEDGAQEEELQEDIEEDGDDFGYDSDKENAESEEEDVDDADDSWITPSNLKDKKKQFTGDFRGEQELKVTFLRRVVAPNLKLFSQVAVACMTTDFAMQNVLKQIGLNILGTDGMVMIPL